VGCLVSFVGWKTLIRLHPKDDTLVVKDCISKLQQTTNILIPNQVSTLSLYESVIASDAAITVNSQAALQASWLGLPVLILGNAFYSAKGFTTDILGQHELLHAGINATLTQGRTTSNQEVVSYLCEMHSQYLLNINDIASATSRITQMARYHK
jgi:capsule polysaccharide modification protein KpsS